MPIPNLETDTIIQICRDAGAAIMEIYQREDLGIESKSDESPLTLADKAANEIICAGLENLAVQYPIISEENKEIPFETRKDYDNVWMVDPLDGTKEFIKRNGEFTVNIALIHENRSIAGFVYAPDLNEMYYAIEGQGAFEIVDGKSIRLKSNVIGLDDEGLKVVGSRSHLNEATQTYLDELNKPVMVPKGSSLKFLILAKGGADLYPRLAPTMEWDTAAAEIILNEAGGSVTQAENNLPMVYNKENLLNPYFIASAKLR